MNEVMSREKAAEFVDKWLDHKRIKANTREAQKTQIDVLVEGMQFGEISLDETDYAIIHKLSFPVTGLLDELKFKARMSVGDLQKIPTKAGDFDGKVVAYIAALTGKGKSHIEKMDSEDYKIGQAISVFFM